MTSDEIIDKMYHEPIAAPWLILDGSITTIEKDAHPLVVADLICSMVTEIVKNAGLLKSGDMTEDEYFVRFDRFWKFVHTNFTAEYWIFASSRALRTGTIVPFNLKHCPSFTPIGMIGGNLIR